MIKRVKSTISVGMFSTFFFLCSLQQAIAGVGESAVITLAFPPGARATGTGEAFTGLADDATATYYNPAGLGLSPLANSWKVHLSDKKHVFTALACKRKKEFGAQTVIWAGTKKGLLRYNGKFWESFQFYLLEQNDNLENVADQFLDVEDKVLLKRAMWKIRTENGIGMKRFEAIKTKLKFALVRKDSSSADSLSASIARQLIEIPSVERSSTKIYGIIAEWIDSTRIDALAEEISTVFQEDDKDIEDLIELKIPFSIAVPDSVTALALDKSNKLWVGTSNGLWRYYEKRWTLYTMLEGLPSNLITSLAPGPYGELCVGTDKGVALFTEGEWVIRTDSTSQLPSDYITSVAFGRNDILYAGTREGLVKIDKQLITVLDTTDGLLTRDIRSLFMDSENRLWVGGPNGVTLFDGTAWKRYRFPNSMVTSFAQQTTRTVWIGTDKGAISYTAGKTITDKQGNTREAPPEWKAFHSKNALIGENVSAVVTSDKDVWLSTDKAINQYDNAERQASLAYERLLPALGLTDLWHLYGTLIWPTQDWGTIGASINYINMGKNPITNSLGEYVRDVRSWEGVFGVHYGLTVRENLALGLGAKYVISALAPGIGDGDEGVGRTFALDAAVLKRNFFLNNFDLGFMFQNIGPDIFYIDRNQSDPIPFTLRLGLAYRLLETPIHDLKILLDMHKEIVKHEFGKEPDPFYKALWTDLVNDTAEDFTYEMQEINYNLGLEWWYTQMLALRSGFLFDYIGERYELTIGVGLRYATFNLDMSYIYAPKGFMKGLLENFEKGKDGATGVRDGQWRISFVSVF